MTRQKGLLAPAALLGAGLLLAGCAGAWPGNWGGNPLTSKTNIESLRAAAPRAGTSSFAGSLASEYLALGESEANQYDWIDSDHFARKGLASAGGNAVAPDAVESRDIPSEKRADLAQARQRLVTALDGGGRDRAPAIAARAQSRYDCWLEQQEENWQIDDIASCRAQFLQAMNDLEARPVAQPPAQPATPPAGAQREYRVYFDFDRSNITPEARQIIEQVAAEAKRGSAARLDLVGKADRSGTDRYNQGLSERRARAVVDALIRAGVPRDRISSRAVGESQPPVPTPDGVREPRNRVVEITVR
jgi:OOP family OmpA-OmpF porin